MDGKLWLEREKPSIKGKLFRLIVFVTILPILVLGTGMVVYNIATDWNARLSSAKVFDEQLQITIEKLLQPADRLLISYAANEDMMNILDSAGTSEADERLAARRRTADAFLKTLNYTNEDIFSIEYALYDGEHFATYSSAYSIDHTDIDAAVKHLQQDDSYGVAMLLPQYHYRQSGTTRYAISLVRLLYDETYRQVGYGVVMIKQKIFNSNLQSLTESSEMNAMGAHILLYDGSNIFYQSDEDAAIQPEELSPLGNQLQGQSLRLTLGGRHCWVYASTSAYTGMTTVVYLPYSILYERLLAAVGMVFAFLAFGLTLLVISGIFFDRYIAHPLDNLSVIMTGGESEAFAQNDEPIVFREIETLYNAYNNMVAQNKILREKELVYRDNLASLEQLTLSTQINPHYFGNVLAMISARAYVEGNMDIVRICENMAATFRYTFKSSMMMPLKAEVGMIGQYVQILRDLYERPLELVTDIPKECENVLLPKVTLQPLVENAVIHSILQKPDAHTITIRAKETDNEICTQVIDDGVGIEPEQLQQLREAMQEDMGQFLKREKRSIGLNTVNYRIIQYFGTAYGVTIESEPGKGTCVSIHLPLRKENG